MNRATHPHRHPWDPHVFRTTVRPHAPAVRGTALDLGCGAGADAIWLAREGWRVTGVDISSAALAHAATEAEAAGLADRIEWLQADLDGGLPDGEWDLVTTAYLHSPVELPREKVLRRAAAAVAPGGTLLVIGHQGHPSWHADPPAEVTFPTADDVVLSLDLDGWIVERAEGIEVEMTSPDGVAGTRTDNVVRLRRPAEPRQ